MLSQRARVRNKKDISALFISHKIPKYYRIWKQEITSVDFDFDVFKNDLLTFVASIKIKNSEFKHRYSRSCSIPVLYASMFACLTLGILGGLVDYSADIKRRWAEYFGSFQTKLPNNSSPWRRQIGRASCRERV